MRERERERERDERERDLGSGDKKPIAKVSLKRTLRTEVRGVLQRASPVQLALRSPGSIVRAFGSGGSRV